MIDSHTHLHICKPSDDELVADAVAAGVTRMVTIGTDIETSALAIAAAERFPEVYAAIGIHPERRDRLQRRRLRGARLSWHSIRACVAVGETGLDYYRDHAPREDQARPSAHRSRSRASSASRS